jgi:saccharopine dehydrogenase-like NADP-dependent oxidoreductase
MKTILILGAGRSARSLIDYFNEKAGEQEWQLLIVDKEKKEPVAEDNSALKFEQADIEEQDKLAELIGNSELVISMLPASLHQKVARQCLASKKSLVTASYVSDEMRAMEKEVEEAGIVFLNEIGLDPGIDHLSAMQEIDAIKQSGGRITDFESFTGGLVAPAYDDNPWHYKFTWNPRNVVLAGQGGAVKFIQEGTYKYIPYHKVFRRTEIIDIAGYGKFEGIANRDSLKYRQVYGLQNVKTMFRGTFRRPGFCRAWDCFVQLGATDDSYTLPNSYEMTFREFINLFLPYNPTDSVELKLRHYLNLHHDEIELFEKLKWLDIFENIPVEIENATPAQVLQKILMRKWELKAGERDMIVMWHKFKYEEQGQQREKQLFMVVEGDEKHTAMAKTVGLPLAMAARLILEGKYQRTGLRLPITADLYQPILKELEGFGIRFEKKG